MSKPALMPLVVIVAVLLVQDAASTTTTFSWNDQPQLVSFTFEGEYLPDAMAMFRNVHNGRLACTTAVPVTWFASQCSSSSTSQLASFLAEGHEVGLHALSESTIPSDLACLSKLTYVRGFRGPQQVRLAAFRSGVLYDSSETASSSSSWPYALTSPGGLFEVDVVQGKSAADTLGRFADNYNGERRPFVLSLTQLSAVVGQQATAQVVSTIMQYADVVAVTASQISRMVFVDSSARADALMNICRQPASSSTTRAPRSLYGQTSSPASPVPTGASEATGSIGSAPKPATTSAPTGQPTRTGSDGTAAPSTRSSSAADSAGTGGTATAPAGTTSAGHNTAPARAGSESNGASTTAPSSTPSATGTVAPATDATTGNGKGGGTRSTAGGIDSGTTAASTTGVPTSASATSVDAISDGPTAAPTTSTDADSGATASPTSTPATSTDAASGATVAPTTTTVPTAVPTSAPTTSADGSAGGNANGGTTATGAPGTTTDNGATSGSAGATGASSGTLASAASAGGAKGDPTSAAASSGSGTTVPTTVAPTPAPTPAGYKSAPTPAPTPAGYQSAPTPAPTSASGKSSSSGPAYVPYVLGAGGCLCALLVFVAYKVRRREDRFPAIVTGGYAFEAEDRDIFDLESDSRLTPFDATTLEAASAVPPMDISTQVADEESLRSFTGFTTSSFTSLTRTTNNVL